MTAETRTMVWGTVAIALTVAMLVVVVAAIVRENMLALALLFVINAARASFDKAQAALKDWKAEIDAMERAR